MKRILAVLITVSFTVISHADSTFYGAWYTVSQTGAVAKDSGAAVIVLQGNVDAEVGDGVAIIRATVNSRGTTIITRGTWSRVNSRVVSIQIGTADYASGQLTWKGKFNTNTGQCSGTWRGERERGRFLTKRE